MYPLGKKQFMFLIQYLVTQEDTYSDKVTLEPATAGTRSVAGYPARS